MKKLIKVPAAGESVTQAVVGEWQKQDGDYVRQNDVLVIMETDKASMDLVAEHSGKLKILKQAGEEVKIGEVLAELDTSAVPPATADSTHKVTSASAIQDSQNVNKDLHSAIDSHVTKKDAGDDVFLSPAVRRLVAESNLDPLKIPGTGPGGRITKADVIAYTELLSTGRQGTQMQSSVAKGQSVPDQRVSDMIRNKISTAASSFRGESKSIAVDSNSIRKERMTTIRRRIAERLVESQHSSATLTTFNELDMSRVMAVRSEYKEAFQKKHGVKLGFMGFFIKAVVRAVEMFPKVNAYIEGDNIIYHRSCHIGVAVSTERGLLVPVIREAEKMGLADLEKAVLSYAEKARDGKISPDDLVGGTFTISNGGVFGSMMSTPILNPPQSGILGLHKIEQRPVAVDGKVCIRPMMYAALSYDHRLVDGRESVGFLMTVKECIEDPIRLLIDL